MANTHTFETRFSKRMQVVHYKKDVFRAFANFEERTNLKDGQSVVRPYRSTLYGQDYTRGSDMTIQDLTDTNETLTVTTAKAVPFAIDDLDALQSNYRLQDEYAKDAAKVLGNLIDGSILSEAANAVNVVDDGVLSTGTASGTPLTLTTSNILTVYAKAAYYMNAQRADMMERFGAISPEFHSVMEEYLAGRETKDGDEVGMNGYVRRRSNFDLYMSTSTYWTGVLSMVTQPTDGDTVVLTVFNEATGAFSNITFTFKTTLGSTAGNVLIGGSADAARANLATLITTPGTTTANGVALSAGDQNLLKGITGTNDNAADTLTLAVVGKGYIRVSETLTDATDAWTKLTQHNLFGRKGAIDVVIQKEPTVKVSDIPKQLGVYVKPHTLYGKKTFLEGTRHLVDVKVNTAAF